MHTLYRDSYEDFAPLMSSDTLDLYEDVSNCCGARIVGGDVCSDCYEHCSPEENEYSKKVSHDTAMGVDYV